MKSGFLDKCAKTWKKCGNQNLLQLIKKVNLESFSKCREKIATECKTIPKTAFWKLWKIKKSLYEFEISFIEK